MSATPAVTAILYPYTEGASFDWDYYLDRHIPLVRRLLDSYGLGAVTVDRGLHGATPDDPPPYEAVVRLEFTDTGAMAAGLAAGGQALVDDVANFTTIAPALQTSAPAQDRSVADGNSPKRS